MTETSIKKNSALVVTVIFIFAVIFGNISIANIHIMGIVPTYYRVLTPILFIICVFWNNKAKKLLLIVKGEEFKTNKLFFAMGAIWIIYGAVSMLISPWSDVSVGIKELISISLGLMSIYVMITLCIQNQFDGIVNILKLVLTATIIMGYVEVFTGWHMSTSILRDSQYLEMMQESYSNVDLALFTHNIATGFFFNPNDYCAFLTILAPLFMYYGRNDHMIIKVLHFIGIGMLFMLLLIDDSFICTIALVIGLICYLMLSKADLKKWLIFAAVIASARICGNAVINFMLKFTSNSPSIQMSELNTMMSLQIENVANDTGSLLYRINTYTVSITEMFTKSKGLGLGAGSFSSYFKEIAESRKMMSNPHSLWVEVLSQYGIIIFVIVIAVFIYIFIKLFISLRMTSDSAYALIMSMGICFIVGCFAPSNFLKGSYYWIIFGLALGLLTKNEIMKKE